MHQKNNKKINKKVFSERFASQEMGCLEGMEEEQADPNLEVGEEVPKPMKRSQVHESPTNNKVHRVRKNNQITTS